MSDAIDVIRRAEALYNSRDLDKLDDLVSRDLVAHTPGSDQIPPGLDGIRAANEQSAQAFPDRRVEIEDVFAEGDTAVVRCRMTGTNKGGMPWFGIPANDAKIDIQWIAMYRVQNGKIVESWAEMDLATMMLQLGAMPTSSGPGGES